MIGTQKEIQDWVKRSVIPMCEVSNGAIHYYPLRDGICFMLAWISGETEEENKYTKDGYTIEASVRKNNSSHFLEDWAYIGEGLLLSTADDADNFARVTDWIYGIVWNYVIPHIYITLPNNEDVELLSEMRTANYDFGDFEETIEDLRRTYYETTDEIEKEVIEQQIAAQCFAFADFLGIQYEDIQLMIGIDDLSIEIKQALIPECAAVKHM